MKTLIKNGRVVTVVDDYRADVFIDGETTSSVVGDPDFGNDSPLYGTIGFCPLIREEVQFNKQTGSVYLVSRSSII